MQGQHIVYDAGCRKAAGDAIIAIILSQWVLVGGHALLKATGHRFHLYTVLFLSRSEQRRTTRDTAELCMYNDNFNM